jgi:3-oxoacyl-[acyl-carrier protein] reductase
MNLNEQIVLVSGAGRGLGAAIARAFAAEGASVVINYRRSEAAALALAEELGDRAVAIQADVSATPSRRSPGKTSRVRWTSRCADRST